VRDEVGVHPYDSVADMRRDLCRSEHEFLSLDFDHLGAHRARSQNEQERAEGRAGEGMAHRRHLLEFCSDVLGVLLVALEDLQPGRKEVLELGVGG
jgi:hypothetical protein